MKYLIVLAAGLALAGGYLINGGRNNNVKPSTDKLKFIRQKNILRLMNHVNMPIVEKDQLDIANGWTIEDNLEKYTNKDAVKEFVWTHKLGMLPKLKTFSVINDLHRKEVISLFHLLYFASDWETFYRTACWARNNVNEGMFVYAMSVAVMHRKDCQGLILPPPYEIYPNFFINSEVIEKANRIKLQGNIHDEKLANYFGINKVGDTLVINSNYSGWYINTNKESKLTYFTEDIGLNTYNYYFNLDYPFWMGGDEYGLNKDRRGEIYYYVHQQLLARFYMERLSNDLGEIPRFSWDLPITTTFMSSLKYSNGLDMPSRLSSLSMKSEKNTWDLTTVKNCEQRILDVIDLGYVVTKDGAMISMKNGDKIDTLGNIIQGNRDCINPRYFCKTMNLAMRLIGNTNKPTDDFFLNPSTLENYETAMRDPMFWQLWKRIMHLFKEFKSHLPTYTREELSFTGVKVKDVTVDELVTYFDNFDVDMTNAFVRNKDEMAKNKNELMFIARQKRLNHAPFTLKMDITSEKTTDCSVRIFIGPKYDGMGLKMKMKDNRHNFFELDSFIYTLKTGKNMLMRKSRDFAMMSKDRTMTRSLMKILDSKIEGTGYFNWDMSEGHNGFPSRLMLPKGKREGLMFQLFVIVSPLQQSKNTYGNGFDTKLSAGVGTGSRFIDSMPLGWPFDRKIVDTWFWTDNMYVKDVMIFHKDIRELPIFPTMRNIDFTNKNTNTLNMESTENTDKETKNFVINKNTENVNIGFEKSKDTIPKNIDTMNVDTTKNQDEDLYFTHRNKDTTSLDNMKSKDKEVFISNAYKNIYITNKDKDILITNKNKDTTYMDTTKNKNKDIFITNKNKDTVNIGITKNEDEDTFVINKNIDTKSKNKDIGISVTSDMGKDKNRKTDYTTRMQMDIY